MARTSRSTGGTSTPSPVMPGTVGATTIRSGPFPYADLLAENGRRGKFDPEYELLDTGVFDDDRYWICEVDYVKADPTDLLMTVRVTNAGPDTETLHVLPTVWFRNTWSWDVGAEKPSLHAGANGTIVIDHPYLGELELLAAAGPDGSEPVALFCENETNTRRLYGVESGTPYPKDGINDHVVGGHDTVNPLAEGTKASLWYQVAVEPAATVELRLRLRPVGAKPAKPSAALGKDFDKAVAQRRRGGRRVLRRADAGRRVARSGSGDAPGVRRDAVEQAAVRLRRVAMVGR